MNKELSSVETIIARLDNDFNIMNSDYIPRVAAWCIDAMNEMGILQYEEKETTINVVDRVAYFPCCMNAFKVYVEGCEISPLKKCKCSYSSGTTEHFVQDRERARERESKRIVEIDPEGYEGKNYVYLRDANAIQLNFDADIVTVSYLTVKTVYSDTFHCNIPVIPNNGKLIEALEWFCMWKLLSRGIKHQVYSLQGAMPVNPYLLWRDSRDRARASVINENQDANAYKGWASFFYNSTFRPRD